MDSRATPATRGALNVTTNPDRRIWFSLFLLSAASLAFEISLTRLFSVSQFYHFAFMVVSIALLGFGASGTALAVFPGLQRIAAHVRLSMCAAGASASMLGAFLLTNWIPFDSFSIAWDRRQIPILILHYIALAAPFFFSGLALGSLLSEFPPLAGTTYAVNLLGSAMGGLIALAAPAVLGAEGTVALCAALAAIAALVTLDRLFVITPLRRIAMSVAVGLLLFSLADIGLRIAGTPSLDLLSLRLSPYKSLSYALQYPAAQLIHQEWNAFSRVDIVRSGAIHALPGLSYRYLRPLPAMDGLLVDGDDLSAVVGANQGGDFVEYLPNAIALRLRPTGSVLILEPRGGLDVLTALDLNSGPKTAVEVNPLIVDVVPVYGDPRVEVLVESSRSFLSRTPSAYDVIILSLSSAFHPVRSGAYALTEEYRYTVEAFEAMRERLDDGGLLIATRWLQDPPSEDLRLFALAASVLENAGGDPRSQLVAFRSFNMAAVLLRNGPFATDELSFIRSFLASRAFDLTYSPGVREAETNRYNVLATSKYYATYSMLLEASPRESFFKDYSYDVRPPTDDRPFFGHYFKWSQAPQVIAEFGKAWQPFGGAGYFVVLALLVLAILLAAVFILLPITLQRLTRRVRASDAFPLRFVLYFGLLGFAFLLVEIPLLQRFILYLSQPAYAVTVVLGSLLLFSGLGSRLSRAVALRPALALLAALVLLQTVLLPRVFDTTLHLPLAARFLIAPLVLAPLGFLMGIPFPAGIRLVGQRPLDGRVAWVWAVNGATSVVASILAALLALTFGFSLVLALGGLCYAAAWATASSLMAPDPHLAR
jgi:hypothetical protein